MINPKYIELINKDIDKNISQLEKQELNEYLENNSEAKELHRELLKTEALLDKLPEREPSINLKKRILNSIDYDRYSNTNKKLSFSEYFARIFAGSPRKIATSFALVLIIGSIILFSIYLIPNFNSNLEDNNIYGTMGLHKPELIEILKIDKENVLGDIEINRENNLYKFKIDVNSVESYNLEIKFNPENIAIENYPSETNVKISQDNSSILFSNSTKLLQEIVFSSKNMSNDKFSIMLFNDENKLFQREIVLSAK